MSDRWSREDLDRVLANSAAKLSAANSRFNRPVSPTSHQSRQKAEKPVSALVEAQKQPSKPRKYRNNPVEHQGVKFDSQKEFQRYLDLVLLERAGKIRSLTCQRTFDLSVNKIKICDYRCDFEYFELRDDGVWEWIVEDVKSPASKTRAYRLKKKLMLAIWRVAIRET